jgi:hypothetical protein
MIDDNITFFTPPEPVGWWILPGGTVGYTIKFSCHKKPNWLVRTSMKYVFGWTYESAT